MNVLLFGATGMIGQGVLRECLLDPDVDRVLTIGRSATGQQHAKLREIVHADLLDLSPIAAELSGLNACFFCLGVTSTGMDEESYRRVTYGFTMEAAQTLVKLNPGMTFIYVSGAGADSTERGRTMWARVRGQTENALLRLPFKTVCVLRPGIVQPLHGAASRTKLYRFFYVLARPIFPLLKAAFPTSVTTTEQIGRAMLKIAKQGAPKPILEMQDIHRV